MNSVFLIYALFGLFILIAFWLLTFEMRLRKFFRGKDGKNLESVITKLIRELELLNKKNKEMDDNLKIIEAKIRRSVQHIGVVRFNPFGDVGGDQSFTLALLDEEKNGAVVSSFYGREMNRVYVKPVQNGNSRHQLSKEEKEAIKLAISQPLGGHNL
jgi:hypothetical protein